METRNYRVILIAIVLLTLMTMMNMCNSCSTKRELSKMKVNSSVDSLASKSDVRKMVNSIDKTIQIEGLKSEHRMIQATDRKMLDINRQNEIEKEILKLTDEKK